MAASRGGVGGGGGLPYESDGDVRRKIEIKPLGRPMWVWLKRKPTTKGGNTQTDMRARVCRVVPAMSCSFSNVRFLCVQWQGVYFLTFLSSALSDTWMGKYGDFLSQASEVRPKPAMYTPKRDDEHPRHFYMGTAQGGGLTPNIDAVWQVLSITKTVQFSANALSCWKDANRLTMHGLYTSQTDSIKVEGQLRPGV